jgi:3-oxoacyl-[acyl-carrier protein] reductase
MITIDCSNKKALVCGSTQGIGKAIALKLAEAGASVTLVARNEQTLAKVITELPISSTQHHDYIVADFGDPQHVLSAVGAYCQSHEPFHILINNTGGPAPGALYEASSEVLLAALSQHLLCSHFLVQLLLPSMKAAQFGRIINIISTSVKQPIPNLGVSNTTRGAVSSWAKTLSFEVAKYGITVNNILPGFMTTSRLSGLVQNIATTQQTTTQKVQSEMLATVPAGRFGSPDELANLAAFLASPLAGYINGTSIAVDGGRTTAL